MVEITHMKAFALHGIVLILVLFIPSSIEVKKYVLHGASHSWTIIPSRSLAGLHYLFKGFEINEEVGLVNVTGPVIEIINGEPFGAKVYKEGYFSQIEIEDFEEETDLAHSVFEATSGSGKFVATAFLVGQDIVFTNRHVLGEKTINHKLECGKFSIKLNHRDENVKCKKVRYCGRNYDFCVVEMEKMKNGFSLSTEIRPLRLTKNIRSHKDQSLIHIGNAGGFGIQASLGKGIILSGGEFFHFAPTLNGSSGAPIFNERGYVVGINWGHSGGNYTNDDSFNRGIQSLTIYKELMSRNPSLLREIKSFRSWYLRSINHRKVKIAISENETPFGIVD